MTCRQRLRAAAPAVVACLLLTACDGGPAKGEDGFDSSQRAERCASSVQSLLAVTQRYLDGLERTSTTSEASPSAAPDAAPDQEEYGRAIDDIRGYAARSGCDPQGFQTDLAVGLAKLTSGGPVAHAVLLQLQSKPRPVDADPLVPGDDVAAAVAAAPSGATVELSAGTFVLGDTLTLLRGVTLLGAGKDATRLQTSDAGGALLVLTPEQVKLDGITVSRTGTAPGPVLSAAPVATLVLTRARVTGARADAKVLGGVGILMSGGNNGQTATTRRTSLRITDSELVDNAVAGVVVAGEHRAEIIRTLVARSGQCGVCFLGTSDGAIRSGRFVDNGAAVVAAGDARPLVVGATVTGGEVGIQAIERSTPEIRQTTVTGSKRAAMIWTGVARGRVDTCRCDNVPFGIVVGPRALPFLGDNACRVARGKE